MSAHAKFSPSKMQRIIACPGSIALESRFPDSRSSYADEGTVAHDMAARCLKENLNAAGFIGNSANVDKEGNVTWSRRSDGKFPIDEQFAEAVQVYVDTVRRRAHGGILLVEQRVEFSKTVGVENQFGTSDAIIIFPKKIVSGDLKFGMGVTVYAAERVPDPQFPTKTITKGNEQCLTYIVAVLETFEDIIDVNEIEEFEVFISQPRLDHEDSHIFTRAEIDAHRAAMSNAVLEATVALKLYENDEDLKSYFFKAGDKQCKFCKAKGICPTLAAFTSDEVFQDMQVLEDPAKMATAEFKLPSPNLIGTRYRNLPLIREYCNAVESEVSRMVRGGMTVVGEDGEPMKLVEGKKGNRKWRDEKVAEGVLAGQMPPDKLYEPKTIVSPAKVGTFFGERRKTPSPMLEHIKELWVQSPGQPQVALGSDPRPAWTGEAGVDEMVDLDDPTQ